MARFWWHCVLSSAVTMCCHVNGSEQRVREAVQTDSELVTAGEVQQLSMTKYDYEGECCYKWGPNSLVHLTNVQDVAWSHKLFLPPLKIPTTGRPCEVYAWLKPIGHTLCPWCCAQYMYINKRLIDYKWYGACSGSCQIYQSAAMSHFWRITEEACSNITIVEYQPISTNISSNILVLKTVSFGMQTAKNPP